MIDEILHKEQFLSAEECDYLVWMAECQPHWDAMPGSPYDNQLLDFFTSLQHRMYSSPALQKLSMQIYRKTQEFVSKASGLDVNFDFMAITRMEPGALAMPYNFDHPNSQRVGGCVTFLNDNFGGGDAYFMNINKSISAVTGSAYVCGVGQDHLHVSREVSGSTRYAIVSTWTTDPLSRVNDERLTKMKDYLEACCSEEKPVVEQ